MIKIVPNMRIETLNLICGDFGPFHPQIATQVPLWLAMALKKRGKCTIRPPKWTSVVDADGNNKSHSRTSVELPIHKIYRILSHIPPLEGTDEKAEHEMWNGLGVFIKEGDCKEHSQHPKADNKQNKVTTPD
ncbi:DNA replication complex GINS protein PSF2 [Camellia lanceoleosa]|uniref:DNA replication complex GINS protein PSF2 n=1 Tax=Camellia lanceoleosa TaxID=1840588 RepID=A0ACC0IZ77_9ERIC|nr:DNA replication complex GINS protein PSF2 [Camellia lanceoleosa]